MKKPIIHPEFIGEDNLEFVLTQGTQDISKILYRSFGDAAVFRKKILNFIISHDLLTKEQNVVIETIFSLVSLDGAIFHFGTDITSGRYKFYISLYHYEFEKSLKILSEIKSILGVSQEYFLEDNFLKFDSLGFDIKDGKIELKVYELLQREEWHDSQNIFAQNIKEYGVLKTISGRKKFFYRFKDFFSIDNFPDLQKIDINTFQSFFKNYEIQRKIRYYCFEGEKKEIYFV